MVKMAALRRKACLRKRISMYPLGKSPRTSGISTIIRATATEQHKHTAPRTCWYGAPLSFQILRSRRPYAGTAVRRGCWGCPSDT